MDHPGPTAAGAEAVYVLPSSFGQERFWALDRLDPGNPAWNVPVRFRLEGALDPALLERAFNEVVRRHEVLRTTFSSATEGPPQQVIAPTLDLHLNVVDLRSLAKADRDAEVDRLSFEEARRRFDLSSGPLFRVGLLRVADLEHVLLVTPHHAVGDYISIGLLADELGVLYASYVRGTPATLPELPIQYGDFAIWQRDQADSDLVLSELSYWQNQLQQLPPLAFPTDTPRPDFPTYDATITSLLLPVTLTDAIRAIGTRHGVTFFNTMLTVLDVLLYQYTGQTDFGVATQVAGRSNLELEKLIGLFVNTIVLRANLAGNPTLADLLEQVQRVGADAIARPNVRFEQVLKALRPQDYPSHHTLFRVNFICQRDPVKPLEFAGIKLTVIPSKSQGALYELNVFLVLRNEGWRLACEYNTDLFTAGTITALLENYRALLEAIAENPDRRIDELPPPRRVNAPPATPAAPVLQPAPHLDAAGSPDDARQVRAAAVPKTITGAEDDYAFDLTPEQRRFWQLEQLMPGNPALNMQAALRLHGPLAIAALQRSFDELLRRHDILRTTFGSVDGRPMQLVHPSLALKLDLRDLPPAAFTDQHALQIARTEALLPFDLAQGPLLRVAIRNFAPDDHLLMITMPHIICDGWSNGVLLRELTALYQAYSTDQPSPLPAPSIQYVDFACWQAEWIANADFKGELAFWKSKLAGRLPTLELPTDRPPVAGIVAAADTETLQLPRAFVDRLKEFCKREEITLFMFFLAAFQTLLYYYSCQQEDILVGSPVAGRNPETENIIGPFAYPIGLRTDLSGGPTVRALLGRVRDVAVDALAHKDLPFSRVLEGLQSEQLQGRSSPFQFYFLHQTAFIQPAQTGDLSWTPLTWVSPGTSFDLHLATLERPDGIVARLEYKSAMFDAATIQRMLNHLRAIVEAFLQTPETPIARIPIEHLERSQALAATPWKDRLPLRNWPLPDGSLRVCDRYLQQQLLGVPGEICIVGSGLRPESEATNPALTRDPRGQLLLRTGHLGRYRPDGSIEHWGLPERHLDLRGFRLPLEPLEDALREHAAVANLCGVPARAPSGDQRPIIYVVVTAGAAIAPTSDQDFRLRRDLCRLAEERYPLYPKILAIVFVKELARDEFGIVVPSRLPVPSPEAYELGTVVAPRDPLELQLVDLWEELLGFKPIGISDSFFDLGGNSVIAARLFTRINAIWNRSLPLSTLFEAPTIGDLADRLRGKRKFTPSSSLVPIRAHGTRHPLFIISGIGGNVIRFHTLSRLLHSDQPVYALQPPGLDSQGPFLTRVEDMAAHYLREIRALQTVGPYYLAGYSFGGIVTFAIAQQLVADGEEVALLAMLDAPEWHYECRRVAQAPWGARLTRYRNILHTLLTDRGRFAYIRNRLQPRFTQMLFQIYRLFGRQLPQTLGNIENVNIHAAGQYLPQPCACHVTVFRSKPPFQTKVDDDAVGWAPYALNGVESYAIPGSHNDITAEPNVGTVAEILQSCLDQAQRLRPAGKANP